MLIFCKDSFFLFECLNNALCSFQLLYAVSMFHPVDYPGWSTNIVLNYIDIVQHMVSYSDKYIPDWSHKLNLWFSGLW